MSGEGFQRGSLVGIGGTIVVLAAAVMEVMVVA